VWSHTSHSRCLFFVAWSPMNRILTGACDRMIHPLRTILVLCGVADERLDPEPFSPPPHAALTRTAAKTPEPRTTEAA